MLKLFGDAKPVAKSVGHWALCPSLLYACDLYISCPPFSHHCHIGCRVQEMGSKGLREKNRRTWRIQVGNGYFRSPLSVWLCCLHNVYHIVDLKWKHQRKKIWDLYKRTNYELSLRTGGHDHCIAETSKISHTRAGQSWFYLVLLACFSVTFQSQHLKYVSTLRGNMHSGREDK